MKEKTPLAECDERIFTLSDVKRLFQRKKRSILRAALIGGLLAFGLLLLKPHKYKIEATFKEGIEKGGGGEYSLNGLLGGGALASQPQAVAVMKSIQVMKPVVEKLGLNAHIPNRGGKISKLYRRIRDNCRAEMRKPLFDADSFGFRNVSCEEEMEFSLFIRFDTRNSFSVLSGDKKILAVGTLGQEVNLPETAFTIVKTPKNLLLNRYYPLRISSSIPIADALRSEIQIASDKTNKSIYNLILFHRDRRLGVQIVNELMSEYQVYLKRDHDQVATEQLAYLETKQEQIFQKISGLFQDHSEVLKRNLKETGYFEVKDESLGILTPLHQMKNKMLAIDVELSFLSQWQKEGKLAPSGGGNPLSAQFLKISRELTELKQQRDVLQLSLRQQNVLEESRFEEQRAQLSEVRLRRDAAIELLSAIERQKEIPKEFTFDAERTLASWAERLKTGGEVEREDFSEYLDDHIRLLSVQEKMIHQGLFIGGETRLEIEGLDLASLRALVVGYHKKLDKCETSMRHYEQLKSDLGQKDFELSSLSSVLQDPLSLSLITEANKISILLKDEKYHSAKEGERWEEELDLQKKILEGHLEQLFKVEALNASLIRERIGGLNQATLGCIHRQISLLTEQESDAVKERKEALFQEKRILERKSNELQILASRVLPDKWLQKQSIDFQSDMAMKMMGTLTELFEAKTIGHHLHRVESKPLDIATLPQLPVKPGLIGKSLVGAAVAGFCVFFAALLGTILRGFPSSIEKLRAMRYPVLGEISPFCDGPEVGEATGSDLELLRQVSLFIESPPRPKILSLLMGRGPDYSYALAENLARRSIRSIVVRCDFQAKFRVEDQPGLLQMWKEEMGELPIRVKKGYDLLTTGGFSPYGVEVIQSAPFQQLLEFLKKKYSFVLLVFRAPLDMAESRAALRLSDRAIVTVSGEPTEQLTPFVNWAYHDGQDRLTLIVSS